MLTEHSTLAELALLPIWEENEQLIEVQPAGESNMNLVLRITTSHRSVILKQSKPYVRKYPQIPAPIERIEIEYAFFQRLNQNPTTAAFLPKTLNYLPDFYILVTEDLGKGSDFSFLYQRKSTQLPVEMVQLMNFFNALHQESAHDFPANLAMRKLNHEHIFHFPFLEDNGLDLDQIQKGLQALSLEFKRNKQLTETIKALGIRYLQNGQTILHGDFYPGSWLTIDGNVKVIDPEFAYPGDKEFDLGVFLAHLDLAGFQPEEVNSLLSHYAHSFDFKLLQAYRGTELLRRLIGIAQLPVNLSLSEKETLLHYASELVLS